jgi:hypothetical protein
VIELVPLKCSQCDTPIHSGPKEIVWVCANCGQGLYLELDAGLTEMVIHYADTKMTSGLRWLPFWVVKGRVKFKERNTYTRNVKADPLWRDVQTFILPAFECTLEQAIDWSTYILRHPLTLIDGLKNAESSVPIEGHDLQALAECVVLTIEAKRKDKITKINFDLDLEKPELWIIPFKVEGTQLHLAINR